MVDTRHRELWPACHRRPIRRNARGFGRGGGGSAPFDPGQIANLIAWYRGDSYAGGSLIDRSGNGRGAASVGTAPAQVVDEGQLAVQFTGAGYFKRAFGTTIAQPFVAYLVAKFTNFSGNYYLYDGGSTSAAVQLVAAGPNLRMLAPTSLAAASAPSEGAIFAVRAVFDGASSSLAVNGTVVASGNAGTNGLDGVTLGSRNDGAGILQGTEYEWFAHSGGFDADLDVKIADYLNARYAGLQITT